VILALAILALLAWLYLAALHGRFWQSGPEVAPGAVPAAPTAVAAVVPARDEAALIGEAVGSLARQDYPGAFRVIVVDDGSGDGTASVARALGSNRVSVLAGSPRPAGWAGKLWAVQQGVAASDEPWLLLTDADIIHEPGHLSALMAQAERSGSDLVSEMVTLRCRSLAERALIPAFVYFFQLLFPFQRVNDPRSPVAAAAGGTVLIRRAALERAGGIAAIRDRLIDDVALAGAVKPRGRIWLGHSGLARSVRRYPGWGDVWRMVARSAYVQLRCSPRLLAGTTLGLALLYLAPPTLALFGPAWARGAGLAAWLVMALTFLPTLRRYRASLLWAPALPAIAVFYMAATIGSAIDHHRGRGVVWKSRAYTARAVP
jgi:hopene-associated glycosyltransferase HpnB